MESPCSKLLQGNPRELRKANRSEMVSKVGTVVEVVEVAIEVAEDDDVGVVLLGVVEVEPPHAESNAVAEITMIESFFTLKVLCCCCLVYSSVSFVPLGNIAYRSRG